MAANSVKNIAHESRRAVKSIEFNRLNSYLHTTLPAVFDFSFNLAYNSVHTNHFDNFLGGEKDFLKHFRDMVIDIHGLSKHTLDQLIHSNNFRHCHKISSEAESIVQEILRELEQQSNDTKQIFDGEEFYQLGLCSEIRFFGIIKGNVFHVCFIDYWHDLEFDQRRNMRNKRNCKFCAINSPLS